MTSDESRRSFLDRIKRPLEALWPGGEKILESAADAHEKDAEDIRLSLAPHAAETEPNPEPETEAAETATDELARLKAENAALQAQIAAASGTEPATTPDPEPEAAPPMSAWQLKVVADFGDGMEPESLEYVAQLYEQRATYSQARDTYAAAGDKADDVAKIDTFLASIEREIRRERSDHAKSTKIAALEAELADIKSGTPDTFTAAELIPKALDAVAGELSDKLPRVAHALADPEARKVYEAQLADLPAQTAEQFWAMAETLLRGFEAVLPAPPKAAPRPAVNPAAEVQRGRDRLSLSNDPRPPLSSDESRLLFMNSRGSA